MLLLAIVLMGGCSIRQVAVRSAADALAGGGSVFASEDDLELAAASIPVALKGSEALIAAQPEHRTLLASTAGGFTQYAYAFVQLPADELEERDVAGAYAERVRARRLYLRARGYGLRALGLSVAQAADPPADLTDKRLRDIGRPDIEALYWTTVSWAAAIALGKDEPRLVATLPQVEALVAKLSTLDPDYGKGALQTFLIGFESSRPGGEAPSEAIARATRRFERAIELSEGTQAAPYVALAEALAQLHGSRASFESLLQQALALDVDRFPANRLANRVAQRRARWLLSQTELYFPE